MRVQAVAVLILCFSAVLSRLAAHRPAAKGPSSEDVTKELDQLFRKYTWGFEIYPPKTFFDRYYRVLKVAASADGVFSDAEKGAYIFNARQIGATDEDIYTLLQEDLSNFDIEATLESLMQDYPSVGKWLVYDCYMIAGADGIGQEEVETIGRIAAHFQLPQEINHGLRYGFEVHYKGKEMTSYYLGDEVRMFS